MDRWRLSSVEIDGFRGVAAKQRFDFQGRGCLLFGPNGQGKSTIALAIQWALFGKFPSGILQNVASSSFLRSHGNATGAYSVRVTFDRPAQKAIVYREAGDFGDLVFQQAKASCATPEVGPDCAKRCYRLPHKSVGRE